MEPQRTVSTPSMLPGAAIRMNKRLRSTNPQIILGIGHGARYAHELLAEAFRDNGVGSLFSDLPSLENRWPDELAFSSHTMGTTRMSASPSNGVVDSDCRVHGVNNLYVAGGSVLSITGANMVTFNLLALALRLSDHLKGKLLQYK